MEKNIFKEGYITEPLCCRAEINTTSSCKSTILIKKRTQIYNSAVVIQWARKHMKKCFKIISH